MSYNGIGLSSAKGSSTSGFVQQSLAFNADSKNARNSNRAGSDKKVVKQDETIKAHKARREIELLVSEYRDKLEDAAEEDHNLSDSVIDEKCKEYRESLLRKIKGEKN